MFLSYSGVAHHSGDAYGHMRQPTVRLRTAEKKLDGFATSDKEKYYLSAPKPMSNLYSIGHGNKSVDELAAVLRHQGVAFVADVRSSPYSRWHPEFNRERLGPQLKLHGLTYVYMGDQLGGRPSDPACYNERGEVDYDKLVARPDFQAGLARLAVADGKGVRLAVMCSEADPAQCHRSKAIGEALLKQYGIDVRHIYGAGKVRMQSQIRSRIKPYEDNLFGKEALHSAKSYR